MRSPTTARSDRPGKVTERAGRAALAPAPAASPAAVQRLQQAAGNRAVGQLVVQRAMSAAERAQLTAAPDWPTFDGLARGFVAAHPAADVDFGEDLGDLVAARGQHLWAAMTYRPWFLQGSARGSLAVKTARQYLAAGATQKADAWYRVVRRGTHVAKNGAVRNLVAPVPSAAEVDEANRHLMRLAPGEVPLAGAPIRTLEANPSYDAGVRYKREMKPTGGVNIAVGMYDSYLATYRLALAANDVPRCGRITAACVNRQFPDPATLINPALPNQIDPALEAVARATVGALQVQYLAGAARDALELRPGIRQGPTPASPGIFGYLRRLLGWAPQAPLYSTAGNFSTHNGVNWALFVLSPAGRVYAAGHRVSSMHHSSPLAGGDVAAAGEIAVNNGTVVGLTNKSGHYTPDEHHTVTMINRLAALGVNTAAVRLRYHDANDGTFWDTNAAGFVNDVAAGTFAGRLAALKATVAARRAAAQVPHDQHQQVPIF